MILQEIKKTHKKMFRSTLIVFEIEKCERDIRENDERRKEDDERSKEDAKRRVYEKNQESIAKKKRLNLKRKQKKRKILKRKEQENKRITLARDAAKIEAKAKVATAVAVKKSRVEKARVEKARVARLGEKNGVRLEKIRESSKAKDFTNKTNDKVKMEKKIYEKGEMKKEKALEKERKEILFKRRMRTEARKQKRKVDKNERYSKRARIKKMKDQKKKACAIIVTLFKKVVASKADKLDAAISEAKAPEKTRSAEARVFKNSKGTVNLRNAPSPSGDLDTNTKYEYVNDLSELLLAKKKVETENLLLEIKLAADAKEKVHSTQCESMRRGVVKHEVKSIQRVNCGGAELL